MGEHSSNFDNSPVGRLCRENLVFGKKNLYINCISIYLLGVGLENSYTVSIDLREIFLFLFSFFFFCVCYQLLLHPYTISTIPLFIFFFERHRVRHLFFHLMSNHHYFVFFMSLTINQSNVAIITVVVYIALEGIHSCFKTSKFVLKTIYYFIFYRLGASGDVDN